METERQRLRVVFEDGRILSKSQKIDGLKRSWVLLKPQLQLQTISDVVSYLLHYFHLHDSCSSGIILSMDGFVLPPFESIAILKDKDLVRVKRKETKLRHVTKAIEGANNKDEAPKISLPRKPQERKPRPTSIEDEIVEKQPLPSSIKLLANEKYDKQTGRGCQGDTIEDEDEAEEGVLPLENIPSRDVVLKKRKSSGRIEISKTKRHRRVTPENVQKKHALGYECTSQKKRQDENGSKGDPISIPDVCMKCTKNVELASKKCIESNGNGESIPSISLGQDGAKKCNGQLPAKDLNTISGSKKELSPNIIDCQHADEESDEEDDLVPVVIRPGHIRFTPFGKVKDFQRNQETNGLDVPSTEKTDWEGYSSQRNAWGVKRNIVKKETFQWNKIMNKRKGQKWGKEKQSTSTWKESRGYNVSPSFPQQDYTSSVGGRLEGTFEWSRTTNKRKGQKWGKGKQPTSSWKESRDYNAHSSWAARKQWPGDAAVDFEKLVPLTDLPQGGDIIAYRLLEMSSSWCPELSSFRMGKIAWFDPESNGIMLVPDPEYPLNLVMKTKDDGDDASGQAPESLAYNEDGSLEIEFPSLVDVRIVKRGDLSKPEGTVTPVAHTIPAPSGTHKREDKTQHWRKNVESEIQDRSKNLVSNFSNGLVQTPGPGILQTFTIIRFMFYSGLPLNSQRQDSSSYQMMLHFTANGKRDVWEEMSEALSAKKAQFMLQDNWNKNSSAKQPWLRRMTILRAQNGT